MMFRLLLGAACALVAGAAQAADQLQYGPPPAWVTPTPIPKTVAGAEAAAQVVLQDAQARYGPDGDEFYTETAIKVLSAQALNSTGNISVVWSPDTETMTVHYLHIIRDGQVIDALAGGRKFAVLRRETNLELSMLDGSLTANIQPEDLRVGDIVDMAVTKQRRDPVRQGLSEGGVLLLRPGIVGRVHVRELWAASKPIRWQATDDLGKGVFARHGDQSELSFDLRDIEAPKAPRQAPLRFARLGELEVSQFQDWAAVSSLMAPLYRKASTLEPASALRAQIERIKAASPDPKVRTEMALRLVEDDVRYVALLLNLGGYTPAAADLTWSRRFGDCKAKTALLLALLNGLGIEAEPALANTAAGDALVDQLPILGSFDHVLVRARIDGKTYWLDGTRLGDRHLEDIQIPGFKWVLPVQASGAQLEKLDPPPLTTPNYERIVRLDATAGFDAAAPAHLEIAYRGDLGLAGHTGLAAMNKSDAERSLREMWTKHYPWITISKVASTYDDDRQVLVLSMDGSAKMDWAKSGSFRVFQIEESNLGYDASFGREPGPHQDAPYSVSHPFYSSQHVSITLPNHGSGFTISNAADVDKIIAGVAYHRVSQVKDGVALMDASSRTMAPEFPSSEAETAGAALREMTRYDVHLNANATAVAAVTARTTARDPNAPVAEAGAIGQRGIAELKARDYAKAAASLTEAIRLDPTNGSYVYDRGAAYFEGGRRDLALADFNAALKLRPSDTLALLARAEVYLSNGDERLASGDFDAAIKIAPNNYQVRFRQAEAYRRTGRFQQAIDGYTAMMSTFPARDAEPSLVGRCRARLGLGKGLDDALADCAAAVQIKPSDLDALSARGQAQLQLGHYDQAIADFDAVLASRASDRTALCGRGSARLAKGQQADGSADIALGGSACRRPTALARLQP